MFTTLPTEVRLLIFEHLFTTNFISINASIHHGVLLKQWILPWEILATSKQTRQEALTKFHIRLTLSIPPQYREALLRSYTRDISHHLPPHLRSAVTILSLEGGITGAYLKPLELFPNLRILRLRSATQQDRTRATTTTDESTHPLLPRLTFRDLLLAHAETGYQETPITAIARDMLQTLILQHNPRLATPTSEIRTFFWHTTKFHIDHGETYIRPMIEFVYDNSRDTVRGVHVRRTRVSSSMAECSTSDQVACVICEFRAKMGVPLTSNSSSSSRHHKFDQEDESI